MDIDPSKLVYMDTKYFDKLQDLARSKLIEMGFDKNQLVFAPDAAKYGEASHYIARIWKSKKRDNTNCIADGEYRRHDSR